jgi:hypothetical protein
MQSKNLKSMLLKLVFILISIISIFFSSSCSKTGENNLVTENPSESLSVTLAPSPIATIIVEVTENIPLKITETVQISEEIDVIPITPNPTQVIAPNGNIYLRTPEGIARFSLGNEDVEDLISIEPDWDSMSMTPSPDRKQLAYWLHAGTHSELWLSELAQWSPKLVFTVSEVEHEWVGLWWLSEHYLLLEPGHFDPQNNFFIPARSFLINVPQQSVEVETGSLIFGCSLAISPQSNQVATWCPAREGWTEPKLFFNTPPSYYVVLEENGGYWSSDLAPTETIVEFRGLPEDIWSWSYQGEYAAFSTYDEVAKEPTLYYIDAQNQSLITVEDDSRSYHSLDWSPDQKYISFRGFCSERSCNKIYDTESQQVVWTSEGLPGAENGTFLNWSYDSKYIVVQSEGITIIDIETSESVRNFKDLGGGVIVWSP